MTNTKTDRRRPVAAVAPPEERASPPIAQAQAAAAAVRATARAKPTAEQLRRREAMRQRLRRAETSQTGLETLAAIAAAPGPLLEGPSAAPHAEALAALRAVDALGRQADPLHCWALFDEAAEASAEELATRWRDELAAALGPETPAHKLAEFVEHHRPKLRQRARVRLHELAEWSAETSPEGRLVEVHRQRPAAWFGEEPPPGPLVVRLTREGREALGRLETAAAPPTFEGADDPQLVKLCACLAELPEGERLKPRPLRDRIAERFAWAPGRSTIDRALARAKRLGLIDYPDADSGKRLGAMLTARGREFAAATAAAT